MNRCPITYEPCQDTYSLKGLRQLSRNLEQLKPLPFSAAELRIEAAQRAAKMSIQGIQPKLSVVLKPQQQQFVIVDNSGRYILKPQSSIFESLPENEDLTMRCAAIAGISAPLHGLLYSKDNTFTYFIKRFDRDGKKKIALEDFAQLTGNTRDTKYNSSMEKVVEVIETYCTFPLLEKSKLFLLTIFNFLIGNEDMHLKNFSLITNNNKVELAPAYDLLNSTIAIKNASEESALTINGKRNKLHRKDLINYFGRERLQLTDKVIEQQLQTINQAIPHWINLIEISFLPLHLKEAYLELLELRRKRLFGCE